MYDDDTALIDFATLWAPFGGEDEFILPRFGVPRSTSVGWMRY